MMRVRAFAKINLSLRVLGIRSDGYHELRTVFQSIALHDTLTIRPTRGPFRLTCDDPACPTDSANLIWRAAAAMWDAAGHRGQPRNVTIALTKRIPIAAGLGGGSSDAAAALRALARIWRVDADRIPEIAASIGADVPYFLEGGTVLGLERGDRLFPLIDAPRAWVTLVTPPFAVGTAEAYAWFDEAGEPETRAPHSINDLQAPVARRHPEIARLANALQRAGASQAAMTGSGSTVFGLFDRRSTASRAAEALATGKRRTLVTRTLPRAEYRRLAGK